jgi:hypothetical protein
MNPEACCEPGDGSQPGERLGKLAAPNVPANENWNEENIG